MAAIYFVLKNTKKTPPGKSVPIYIRLVDGKSVDVMAATKYNILPDDWSKTKQAPLRPKDALFKKLNSDLLSLKASLLKHYNESDRAEVSTAWLKAFINPDANPSASGPPAALLAYFDYYLRLKKEISENSIERYGIIKNKLLRFESELGAKLLIKNINLDFKDRFEQFCEKHKYSNNTIASDLHFIRIMCRNASRRGVIVSKELDDITKSFVDVDTTYLTPEDLEKIKKASLSNTMQNYRDWLIISCYTGQRVSDFMRFNMSMIRYDENNGKKIPLIEFTQEKGDKIMTLPLHKEVMDIVKARNGFPKVVTPEQYNTNIKLVCKAAGLKEVIPGSKKVNVGKDKDGKNMFRMVAGNYPKHELVTSHIGRRSFATNFYSKIPTSLLIAATGHKTEEMFLRYIRKSSSDRAKELAAHFGY